MGVFFRVEHSKLLLGLEPKTKGLENLRANHCAIGVLNNLSTPTSQMDLNHQPQDLQSRALTIELWEVIQLE